MSGQHLKLPKQFGLAGHVIKVRYKKLGRSDGMYEDATKTIWLDSSLKKALASHHFAVFAHELYHAIFAHTGRDDLFYDEALVDSMAHLTIQAIEALIVANTK